MKKSRTLSNALLISVFTLMGVCLFVLAVLVCSPEPQQCPHASAIKSNTEWREEVNQDLIRWRRAENKYYSE